MKKITVKTPQKQFCVHAVIMKSCTYITAVCIKTVLKMFQQWSFFINHIPNVVTEVVLYCKSGHNFSDNFNKIIKKGPNLEKWN